MFGLAACSGSEVNIGDASSDGSGSDGSKAEGGTNDSGADSGSDGGREGGGPGTCPNCNDGFACCMVMSSGNYMKCTAKNCLACCM